MTCTLDACKVCTSCAHNRHHACRLKIRCPDTGEFFACRCCGKKKDTA